MSRISRSLMALVLMAAAPAALALPEPSALEGLVEVAEFRVDLGRTVRFLGEVTIRADRVVVSGTLAGAPGASLLIEGREVFVDGAILAGDGIDAVLSFSSVGEPGGAGGSVRIVADSLSFGSDAFLRSGSGGKGADVRESGRDVVVTGGAGGWGGDVVLAAVRLTGDPWVLLGNGGPGGAAHAVGVDGDVLIPDGGSATAFGGAGGGFGLLVLPSGVVFHRAMGGDGGNGGLADAQAGAGLSAPPPDISDLFGHLPPGLVPALPDPGEVVGLTPLGGCGDGVSDAQTGNPGSDSLVTGGGGGMAIASGAAGVTCYGTGLNGGNGGEAHAKGGQGGAGTLGTGGRGGDAGAGAGNGGDGSSGTLGGAGSRGCSIWGGWFDGPGGNGANGGKGGDGGQGGRSSAVGGDGGYGLLAGGAGGNVLQSHGGDGGWGQSGGKGGPGGDGNPGGNGGRGGNGGNGGGGGDAVYRPGAGGRGTLGLTTGPAGSFSNLDSGNGGNAGGKGLGGTPGSPCRSGQNSGFAGPNGLDGASGSWGQVRPL